jgi:hypothetical protein
MGHREMGLEGVDLIHMAKDREWRQLLTKHGNETSIKAEEFLDYLNIILYQLSLLHGVRSDVIVHEKLLMSYSKLDLTTCLLYIHTLSTSRPRAS